VRRLTLWFLLVPAACAVALTAASEAQAGAWSYPGQMTMSADGKFLYATGGGTLTFARNASSGALTMIDRFAPGGNSLAVAGGGRWAYIGSNNYAPLGIYVLTRDPASGLLVHDRTIRGGYGAGYAIGSIVQLMSSPDGRQLYVAQQGPGAMLVFDVDADSGALSLRQSFYDITGEMALAPDGRNVYLSTYNQIVVFGRDPATGALDQRTPVTRRASGWAIAVSPDGARVYAGGAEYEVFDRDPASGGLTRRSESGLSDPACSDCAVGRSIAVWPDSSFVLSGQNETDRLLQARVTAEGVVAAGTYQHDPGSPAGINNISGMAWSPDGRFLYAASSPRSLFSNELPGSYAGSIHLFRREGEALAHVSVVTPAVKSSRHVPASVSIDDGAVYTNDPHVTVTVTPPPDWGATSLRLANDPGFAGAELRRLSEDGRYPWELSTSPSARSVKHVYVRQTPWAPVETVDYSDDIILDQRLPTVLSAKVTRAGSRSRLLLRAKDNRSGVKKLQVTTRKSRPGKRKRFTRKLGLKGNPRRLYVRVFDGAGNRSRWRVARR
jgi:6-phosphogluconolactonase (cycloisomerase 2 family)